MKSITKQEKRYQRRQYMFHKKTAATALLLVVVLLLSGCNNTVISTTTETMPDSSNFVPTSSAVLNIGYSQTDSLNPYFMNTDINNDIISLIYEALFTLDDSFNARNSLAASYTLKETALTVKLDTAAAFSDGVQFSSADVIYSFNMAKASAKYKNELLNVLSATAAAADTVIFTLKEPVRNAADSLTFPVVKAATADNADARPTGTGLYSYNTSGEDITLDYNPYCRKPRPNIAKVKLIPITPASTLLHTLELGTIDAYFDDFSAGSYSQANAATAKTNLTNLVFLGINSNSYGLSSALVRQAIYFSLNRQAIAKDSFKNYAVPSSVPYHPEWHVLTEAAFDISSLTLDYSAARDLLTKAGITEELNYTMIVYSGNNFKIAAAKEIQKNLRNIGINLIIKELSWDEYTLALADNAYSFYIGEIKLPGNMDLTALFSTSGPVKGIRADDTTAAAYNQFRSGKISIDAFTQSFLQNIPFVPVCFRMGALIYSDDITPAADCDINNAYKNVYEWEKLN